MKKDKEQQKRAAAKAKVLEKWQDGDNAAVAREMFRLFGIEITRHSVRLWRKGETEKTHLETFYLKAAKSVQKKRKGATPAAAE